MIVMVSSWFTAASLRFEGRAPLSSRLEIKSGG